MHIVLHYILFYCITYLLFLTFLLLTLVLNRFRRLTSLLNRNGPALDGTIPNPRSCNSQNPVRRQTRLHLVNIVPLGQRILPHKLPRNVSVLVLLLFVLALDLDGVPGGLHGDFLRSKVLHVQINLKLVLVDGHGRTGVLLGRPGQPGAVVAQGAAEVLPEVAGKRWSQEVLRVQTQAELLVQNARRPEGIVEWQQRHRGF